MESALLVPYLSKLIEKYLNDLNLLPQNKKQNEEGIANIDIIRNPINQKLKFLLQ